MSKKVNIGDKIRVVADSFQHDPHGLDIGSEYEVIKIHAAVPIEKIDPFTRLQLAMHGIEAFDVPERVHVKFGDGSEDYANLVHNDFVVVEGVHITQIRMLDDDISDGYARGQKFEVVNNEYFLDNDGDTRLLMALAGEYEIID